MIHMAHLSEQCVPVPFDRWGLEMALKLAELDRVGLVRLHFWLQKVGFALFR